MTSGSCALPSVQCKVLASLNLILTCLGKYIAPWLRCGEKLGSPLCPWKISISLDCGNLQNQCCTYKKLGQSLVVWLGCLARSHQHTCGDHPGAWGMLANYLTSLPLCVTECLQAVWLLFWGFMFLSVVLFSSLTRFLVWSAQASPGYPAWLSVLPQTPSPWPPPQISRALSS